MGAVKEEEATQPLWMTACEDLGDNGSDIVSNEPDRVVEPDRVEEGAEIIS
jgi:hypothetical protein